MGAGINVRIEDNFKNMTNYSIGKENNELVISFASGKSQGTELARIPMDNITTLRYPKNVGKAREAAAGDWSQIYRIEHNVQLTPYAVERIGDGKIIIAVEPVNTHTFISFFPPEKVNLEKTGLMQKMTRGNAASTSAEKVFNQKQRGIVQTATNVPALTAAPPQPAPAPTAVPIPQAAAAATTTTFGGRRIKKNTKRGGRKRLTKRGGRKKLTKRGGTKKKRIKKHTRNFRRTKKRSRRRSYRRSRN